MDFQNSNYGIFKYLYNKDSANYYNEFSFNSVGNWNNYNPKDAIYKIPDSKYWETIDVDNP